MSEADEAEIAADSHTQSSPLWKRKWLKWLAGGIGVGVTAACLYVAAPKKPKELAQLGDAFRNANYAILPLFLGLLALFYWLKAYRWRLLLLPMGDFPTRKLIPSMMIGFGVNNVVPAHLGEFARIGAFWRESKVSFSSVLSTVALERLFDLIAILTLLGIGLVLVEDIDPAIQQLGLVVAAVTAVGVCGAAIYVFFTDYVLHVVRVVFRILPLPQSFEDKVLALAESGAAGLKSIRSPALLAQIIIVSFVKWGINGLLAWVALYAFGIQLSAAMSFVLLGAIALAVTMPATPGYFGVIQVAFWLVLQTQPDLVDRKADIFAASIFYHMAQWIPVTLIGLGYLARVMKVGLTMSDLTNRPESAEATEPLPTTSSTSV